MKKYRLPFMQLKQKKIESTEKRKNKLCIALGKNEENESVYLDLSAAGHLLMAGVSRSGKSVCLHTIAVSLLLKNSFEDVRFVFIDPKKTEFKVYNNLPHLAMPILTEPIQILSGLKKITEVIENRRKLIGRQEVLMRLPKIVIFADEYADLITQFGFEAKDALVRILQQGSQVGIHLILSTVRITPQILFGTIKAAIPTRIAFRVAKDMDSMIILDTAGAENLKGYGDMLFKNENSLIHLQGAYFEPVEIMNICDFIRKHFTASYLLSIEEYDKIEIEEPLHINDEIIYQVALFCIEKNYVSINRIQNRFCLRFNDAAQIIKELENRGIISRRQGTEDRRILVDEAQLKAILKL